MNDDDPRLEEAVDAPRRTGQSLPEDIEEAAHVRKFRKELNAGTVSLVLLTLLERSDRAMYGYEIAKILEAMAEETAPVKQGTLYPVLRSLEGAGFLESEVEPSSSGPPRKYYRITDRGREALDAWREVWEQTRLLVDTALEWEPSDDDDR